MSNLTAGKLFIPYARMARKKLTRETGPQGRIDLLRKTVTNLLNTERIELPHFVGYEARQYVERLVDLAKKYGDKHEGMMEMADYWLLDKRLVPKLFQQLVPRYANHTGPYTLVHKLPVEYPGSAKKHKIVMELKGNPYPPINAKVRDLSYSLTNMLIKGMKQDYKFNNKTIETK